MFEKEKTFIKNLVSQFDVIEKALLRAKKEGKKTINLKEELARDNFEDSIQDEVELIQSPKYEPTIAEQYGAYQDENGEWVI